MYEGGGDTDDAKEERCEREEPTRTHPLASNGGGDFEEDIRDVKDREDLVVVVTLKLEILSESGDTRVA
jgi:hypothetical protein